MPSMSEVMTEHTALTEADQDWLRRLVLEWQLLADLSFSDLLLWVPEPDGNVFWAAAQIRPTTGPTALVDDVVGDLIAYSPEHLVAEAFLSGEVAETSPGKLLAEIPVGVHAIPVRVGGRVIAVVEQHTNQLALRNLGVLEEAYLHSAAELVEMVAQGLFPGRNNGAISSVGLRVGDGFIRLDEEGDVIYASPNALSAYRRLGLTADLSDEHLATVTAELVPTPVGPVDDSVESVLSGRAGREVEVVVGEAHLLMRSIPLSRAGQRSGAIILCRDVTDLRSRERQLVTKDATIREIHHRVKNNLQTVAALLRMQARRIEAPEAKLALHEAMSRVASIAIVHETLSQAFDDTVEFDRVADPLLRMVGDLAATTGTVTARRVGSFGVVSADIAANLSLVMTELCQNAIEHGLANSPGELRVLPQAIGDRLLLEVIDDGHGLPEDFSLESSRSLGLSIVTTLVEELQGTFTLGPNPSGRGTRAAVDVPLASQRHRFANQAAASAETQSAGEPPALLSKD